MITSEIFVSNLISHMPDDSIFRMDNFVDVLAELVIGDSPIVIDEDGNETDLLIDIVRSVLFWGYNR